MNKFKYNIRWYNLDQDWIDDFKNDVEQGTLYVYGTQLKNVDLNRIFKTGAFNYDTFNFHKGKVTLRTSITELTASGLFDIITEFIKVNDLLRYVENENVYDFFYSYCLTQDQEKSLKMLEIWQKLKNENGFLPYDTGLLPAVLMFLVYNKKEKAKKYLEDFRHKYGKTLYSPRSAKVYGLVFNDKNKAEHIINKIDSNLSRIIYDNSNDSTKDHTLGSWTMLAETWMDIFNDKNIAMEFMKKGIIYEMDYFWLKRASIFMSYFNDKDKAIFCLGEAEKNIEDIDDYFLIAGPWQVFFKDRDKVASILRKVENSDMPEKSTSYYYGELTDYWYDILLDFENAERCLKISAKCAENAIDLIYCAKQWIRIFNDTENAKKCLENAKKYTKDDHELDEYKKMVAEILEKESAN